MGFKAGTTVTVDNALKMLMVKSANDMAVALAEGVGGSIEGFADMMNANARRLGMTQSQFRQPERPAGRRPVTSARDLGILARALIHEFPRIRLLLAHPRRSATASGSCATTIRCSTAIPAPTA